MKYYFIDVRYRIKDGKREEFCQKAVELGIVSDTRAESGNLRYDFSYPIDAKDEVCLFEIWESPEAQKLHYATAHYKRFAKLKAEYALDTKIECAFLEKECQ